MTEVLVLVERVRNTIRLGESQFREFKSAYEGLPGSKRPRKWVEICRAVAEGLVAFANADGGELLVGIEDDGTITGVPHTLEEIEKILNAPKTHVHADSKLPMQSVTSLEIDSKVILFFSVTKGTEEIYQMPDGRCLRRIGANTSPESIDRITFERREARSRSYDSEFIDDVLVTDLDINRVQSMADEYLMGITAEKYLQQIGLAEFALGGLRLRRAAVLLFARDIQRWHPRCQVRILKVQGDILKSGNEYNVISDQFVQGNVFDLLGKSWDALRPFLAYKTEFGIDARFEQKYIYPEGACREALVNAIAHRDFVLQNGVDIFVFDDRMEIKSPGSLLSTLTMGQLLRLEGSHESRNALIARVLRESGYMRELGEGMKRIFRLMEENDLIQPKLSTDLNSFTVTLFNRSVFNDQQRFWLSMFDKYELSRNQQRIVVAGMNGRELSPLDIYRAMNTRDRDTYDKEVSSLRKTGVLQEIRTNPQASKISQQTGQAKITIPRFKVVIPNQFNATMH
jgi:ATP-dependent DNA helicase RecG